MNDPASFSLKVLNTVYYLAQWTYPSSRFILGHGFLSKIVLPTPNKRAQQRNKGMAENMQRKGNDYCTSDCLGVGSSLQFLLY